MIIAIDGPAASGKGTLGKRLAAHYRPAAISTPGCSIARWRRRCSMPAISSTTRARGAVARRARSGAVRRGGAQAVTRLARRRRWSPPFRRCAPRCSTSSGVRRQPARRRARRPRHRHRDLPDADVKIFVTATPDVRSSRRFLEMQSHGSAVSLYEVQSDIARRDERDHVARLHRSCLHSMRACSIRRT